MSQIGAGINKEWLFFWRGFRFGGMIFTFLGCALIYPVISFMMIMMQDMYEIAGLPPVMAASPGMDMYGDISALLELFTGESGLLVSYISTLGMFSSTALTIAMVLLIGAAGVEQKKRSIIMPQTAGLTSAGYVLPKFMLYPPLVFAMTLLSALLSNVANRLVFGIAYSAETVLATGTLYGVSLMFSVCLYLLLGISLVQPGLSIIYVVAGNWLFSFMLNDVFGIDRFTPWSLISMADNIVIMGATPDMQAIAVTVAITIVLCAMLMLLTLYAMFAKRMDNTADEVY